MKRAFSSMFCGLISLVGAYGAPTNDASACRCLPPEITRDYAQSDRVFRGTVLWSIEFAQRRYFLVRPSKAYKGCLAPRNFEWVSTAQSSAACGANYSVGQDILFFTSGAAASSGIQGTSSCSGNRVFADLSAKELAFLDTRYNCCGEDCSCNDGSAPVNCLVDPCEVTEPCDTDKAITCVANYCGGCNAEFIDEQGALACQGPARCELDSDCQDDEYCGAQGQCVQDGSCTMNYECNLPGNNFNNTKRCLGYGECKADRCEYQCGSPKCIDHEGYDFGDCEMYIGFVRIGDHCEGVSGCGSLIPGEGAFASKEACESACVEPASFACGKTKRCELGSEYCLETIPGAAPEPGTTVESNFDCQPFEVECSGVPSCESCIKPGPFGMFYCKDQPNGVVQVTVPMP